VPRTRCAWGRRHSSNEPQPKLTLTHTVIAVRRWVLACQKRAARNLCCCRGSRGAQRVHNSESLECLCALWRRSELGRNNPTPPNQPWGLDGGAVAGGGAETRAGDLPEGRRFSFQRRACARLAAPVPLVQWPFEAWSCQCTQIAEQLPSPHSVAAFGAAAYCGVWFALRTNELLVRWTPHAPDYAHMYRMSMLQELRVQTIPY
jgi:hypothetical protein